MSIPRKGLHKTHPAIALCLLGLVVFWGFLGLGYLLSPPENIITTGSFEYVSKVPRLFWGFSMFGTSLLMAYGLYSIPHGRVLLRWVLAFGALLCIARGVLTSLPYFIDLISGHGDSSPSSFGGFPTYWCIFFVHIGCLIEPFRNPLTERR